MDLIIVESPAKARTITGLLGSRYKVASCMGHVRDLPKKRLGVDIKNNFKPEYTAIKERSAVIKELKEKAGSADRVLLAADPDREGEAICWHLFTALKLEDTCCRISFNEITAEALKQSVKKPGEIDLRKVDAQQARRILDRIVGYLVSRILWSKVGKGTSAGRVQSVALRIICEREQEIENFVPEEYWTISAMLENGSGEKFKAKLEKHSGKKLAIKNEKQAVEILEELKKEKFFVEKITRKKEARHPPPPFITSTLQQEAANKLGFTAARTMRVAQQLYEGLDTGVGGPAGLITYMRTDSVRVSGEARGKCVDYIRKKFGKDYVPQKPRVYRSRKGAQEAHEAIRPTEPAREPEQLKPYLSADQMKLYALIWRRFLASHTKSAEIDSTSADISAGKYGFSAKGQTVRFPGFLAIYPDAEQKYAPLPELGEKEKLNPLEIAPKQNFTSPPPRYSEASLIKTLEEKGIGRPSTYASIISTILARDYVLREKGKFLPTELGRTVNRLLVGSFSEVFNEEFTAKMEKELDGVEEGREAWAGVVGDFYRPFEKSLQKAKDGMENVKESLQKETGLKCEKCGEKMVIKRGRFGEFIACTGFPKCKNSKPLLRETGVSCPETGCGGKIIERKTRRGRIFYGCSRYPACKFALWDKPAEGKCAKCGAGFLIEKKRKGLTVLSCHDKECGFSEEIRESKARE